MSWLARLKKTDASPAENLTKPVIATAANDPTPDPDRWCWPNSEAMNTAEINTFMARVRQFTGQGLSESEAEVMADAMLKRDREGHLCDSPINGLPGAASPKPEPTVPDTPTSFNGGSKASQSRTLYTAGDWRPLAQAYHAHHFGCPVCVAAGLGYGLRCGAGAALWATYQNTN